MRKPRKVKGGYQGRITVDGKDRSVGVYASQRAAIEAQADAIAKLRRGDFVREHVGSTTVKEYGALWLKARAGEVEGSSLSNYERHLRLHIYPVWGSRELGSIRPSEVKAWWGTIQDKPSSRLVYNTFSNLFKLAVDDGEVQVSPVRVRGTSKDRTAPRPYFDQDDLQRLWSHLDPDIRAFIVVTYGGALRLGEALGLDRRHVNLETGEVRIEQQFTRETGRGSFIKKRTKTGKDRTVWLGPMELAMARDYAKRHPALPNAPFFMGEKGGRLDRPLVYKRWHKARALAELPEIRIHDMRHSSLSQLMESGASLTEVMDFAGHDDMRSAKRYQHANPDRLRELVKKRSASLA